MPSTRSVTLITKQSNQPSSALPASAATGEALVNTADGKLYYKGFISGTGSTTFVPSLSNGAFFEVGSHLSQLALDDKIITYSGVSGGGLVGKFLSGTSAGFVLANISAIATSDTYLTGATFANNLLSLTRNDAVVISTLINNFTGLTVNGLLSANTINAGSVSATTFSGGTYFGNASGLTNFVGIPVITNTAVTFTTNLLTITNSTGGTVSTLINNFSALTVNGLLSANTINSSLVSATTISAGTLFINGTQITGDTFSTGATFSNNTLTITKNNGTSFNTIINNFTGLTVNGLLSANTIQTSSLSATSVTASTLFVNGTQITGNTNIYTSDGTIISNRTVGLSSFTLNFSSATQPDTLVMSGGNVGIGTNAPLAKLDVKGNINFPTTTASTFGVISQNGTPILQTFGTSNLFLGPSAGNFTMVGVGQNISIGLSSFTQNTTGFNNTAIGVLALQSNTGGSYNIAIGPNAVQNNTNGLYNIGIGAQALQLNTTGTTNVGVGLNALMNNVSGSNNTAIGGYALLNNNNSNNTAIGLQALQSNTAGTGNVAIGFNAGFNELGSNKLYIANAAGVPLIYGDFANKFVGINTTATTNALTVTAATNPVKFVGLQAGSDGTLLTTDATGVIHTIAMSALTGVSATTIYNGDGTIIGNRTVGLSSFTLSFSSATQPNTLVMSGGNVGIGTSTPLFKLDVNGSINFPTTSASTFGVIRQNGTSFLHSYGTNNLFLGTSAGNFTMTGIGQNVGVGVNSLTANSGGTGNVGLGYDSLLSNVTGINNTALGTNALNVNVSGSNITAVGYGALQNNTIGNNTAVGYQALTLNTSGATNTAVGYLSLTSNIGGAGNVAVGFSSSQKNVTGNNNIAIGPMSLFSNLSGSNNTALGVNTLQNTTSGSNNTALGYQALNNNVGGGGNVAIGSNAGFGETGNNKLYIANAAGIPLIYGDFAASTVGINTTAGTNTLTVSGATDPLKLIGLQAGNDTLFLTVDGTGVLHTKNNVLTGSSSISAVTLAGNVLTVTSNGGAPVNTTINAATGGTYANGTITLSGTGVLSNITGITGTFSTGVTFNTNLLTITRNDGVSFSTLINNFSALTVNGLLSANTIQAGSVSATTFSGGTFFGNGSGLTGLSSSSTVTGATFTNNLLTLTNNTGGTVSTFINNFSSLTVNGVTTITGNTNISGTTTVIGDLTAANLFTRPDGRASVGSGGLIIGSGGTLTTRGVGDLVVNGNLTVFGNSISAMTSQLYVEDNNIIINYNPSGSTYLTGLGAGFTIQDGLAVSAASGTSVFLQIAETGVPTTVPDAYGKIFWETNVFNMMVGSSGGTGTGMYLLKETDILNGGVY